MLDFRLDPICGLRLNSAQRLFHPNMLTLPQSAVAPRAEGEPVTVISAASVNANIQQTTSQLGFSACTAELNMHQLLEMESWNADFLAEYEERAAIYEFLGNLTGESAAVRAYVDVFKALHGNRSYYPDV
jgi:hypothetical protein